MIVHQLEKLIEWNSIDLHRETIDQDWFGEKVETSPFYSLAIDPEKLWLIAGHSRKPIVHPDAKSGKFTPELWKYDLVEMFIADPHSNRYMEFNLAPNNAWWSCEYTTPRIRTYKKDEILPEVKTYEKHSSDGSWTVGIAIPLYILRARLNFGFESLMNVNFILYSPDQKFFSVAKLPKKEPDYHQPAYFSKIVIK
jgi:hypothetical protein